MALDARTGEQIWEYERPLPADLPLCCGRVNRGLAVYGDMLFYGSPDGYLVAINANNGTVIWETLVAKPSEMYSMTGAPLVVNRSVVVGVAGSEYGVRGFLAAYDISPEKGNGNLKRSRALARLDTKLGKTTHGERGRHHLGHWEL